MIIVIVWQLLLCNQNEDKSFMLNEFYSQIYKSLVDSAQTYKQLNIIIVEN